MWVTDKNKSLALNPLTCHWEAEPLPSDHTDRFCLASGSGAKMSFQLPPSLSTLKLDMVLATYEDLRSKGCFSSIDLDTLCVLAFTMKTDPEKYHQILAEYIDKEG